MHCIVVALPQALLFMLFIFWLLAEIFTIVVCHPYHVLYFFMPSLLLGLLTALTSDIATSSKVIRMLPELLRARVMTWP